MITFDELLTRIADGTISPDEVQSASGSVNPSEREALMDAVASRAANGEPLDILTP